MDGILVRRAVAAGVSFALVAGPVMAQAPGPALRPPTGAPAGDPPARVGRLAQVSGTVSFHLAGADRWDAASLNLPVATGSAFWTEPGAKAALEVTGTRVGMAPSTELDVTELDDNAFVAALPQGEVCVHVRTLPPNTAMVVQTPRGQVSLTQVGHYDVVAGDTAHPTVVTVVDGAATIDTQPAAAPPGGPAAAQVKAAANQAVTISGDGQTTPFATTLGAAQKDAFLTACLADDLPARPRTVQVPADVEQMTGGYALDQYGEWGTAPEYGTIWYPPVQAGYVPYRDGHWGYVAPWGWTWVDNAPWGFAPSHYGRWVQVQDRWGWIPGGGPLTPGFEAPRYPVYAPAVVSFLAGAAVGAVVAGGLERGFVGWVPLGPREAYYPPYRASATYVRNLNITHVQNVTSVVNNYNTVINRGPAGAINRGAFSQGPQFGSGALVNRAAATSIPAAAMAGSQNVATLARPVPAAALGGATPLVARPPITPTQATMGITPAVARQFHVQAQPARPAAPGPTLRAAGPGAAPGRPGLGGAGAAALGGAALGGAAVGAAAAGLRPGGPAALPPLRPTGPVGETRPNAGAPGPAIGPRPTNEPVRPGEPSGAVRPGEARPEARPEPPRPEPGHPEPGRPEPGRPEPGRPEPGRPEPAARPAPEGRPAPEARPEPRPEPAPRAAPQSRPAPQPAPRPAPVPQARPVPQAHPAPQARPMPHARPMPQARPAPPPRPAEAQRPAPHPAPGGHPQEERR